MAATAKPVRKNIKETKLRVKKSHKEKLGNAMEKIMRPKTKKHIETVKSQGGFKKKLNAAKRSV